MNYYVYLLLTKSGKNYISYVGYTSNLINRLFLHNSSNGAKFTKGRKWVIYSKKYNSKSKALKEEYKLKKDYKKRKKIKNNYLLKNEKAT